jgi:F-type H+-transporting ATPase subunit c
MKNKILLALVTVLAAVPALAQTAAPAADVVNANVGGTLGYVALAIAIMMGLAVFGGTFSQGRAASAALEGIARNPAVAGKLLVPLILSLALIESLVLFAFLIGFGLRGPVVEVLEKLATKM